MIVVQTAWDALVNAATAALLAGFGFWIWTLTPRTRLTRMLGLFAIAHGLLYVVSNLFQGSSSWFLFFLVTVGFVASSWGLLGTAHEVLRSLGSRGPRLWWGAVTAVAIAALPMALQGAAGSGWHPLGILRSLAFSVFVMSSAALPLVFAWMHRDPPDGQEERVRRQAPILSAALALWPAQWASSIGFALGVGQLSFGWGGFVFGWVVLLAVAATGVVWLANISASVRHARASRNVAWLIFALLLFGTVDRLVLSDVLRYSISGGPFFGVARLATVVVLSYAVLKHEILGFDVRIRWGISRMTIAGVFVAVFFVVSEATQLFLGQTIGSEYLGIAAAGALVFAIAPLQRAAERLAQRAVPVTDAPGAAPLAEAEAAYAAAVRAAVRDDVLTRREERHLADVAEHLGIGPKRALELRELVEQEGTA